MFFLLGGAVKIESYSVSQATVKLTILLNILVLLTRPLTEMGSVSIFGSSRPHRGHSREGIFGNAASFTSDTHPNHPDPQEVHRTFIINTYAGLGPELLG